MVTPHVFPFLTGGRTLRRFRSELQQHLAAELALRLLPALADLPLGLIPLPDPADLLAGPQHIAVRGPAASGRSLALLQICARWAAAGTPTPTVYLSLAARDSSSLSPHALVSEAARQAGLPSIAADGARPWLLLIDDWEELRADRRSAWRSFIGSAACSWSGARMVVVLPPGEEWEELRTIDLQTPDDDRLAAWFGQLLPAHDAQPIIEALNRPALHGMRTRISDLLLLALTYPMSGMPASRSELYAQAYGLVRPLLDAYDERQTDVDEALAGAAETNIASRWPIIVGRAALRYYRLARSLAGGDDLAILADLPAHERAAVAPLAAGLLDDPTAVLRLLWGDGEPAQASLRALTSCLCERPGDTPTLGMALVERLVALRDFQLIDEAAPALPALLSAASRRELDRSIDLLYALQADKPSAQNQTLLPALINSSTAAPALRWVAADLLVETGDRRQETGDGRQADKGTGGGRRETGDESNEPSFVVRRPSSVVSSSSFVDPCDDLAAAARVYVLALAGQEGRRELSAPELQAGLAALLGGVGGGRRGRKTALALLADKELPDNLRLLALNPLTVDETDNTFLLQSLGDASAELRAAALQTLTQRPPTQALRILNQVISAPDTSDTVRLALIEAVAAYPQSEAVALLARYILDERYGLLLRLNAGSYLARRGAGPEILRRILPLKRLPAALRAAIAGWLGQCGQPTACAMLRHILLDEEAEPLLRRAAVAALVAIGKSPGGYSSTVAALVAALMQPTLDSLLLAHIANGLGELGAVATIPNLAALLAPQRALDLQHAWAGIAPQLSVLSADQWPDIDLPLPVRAILMDILAEGTTFAAPPSSLEELADREAERVAEAAAAALAAIVESRPALRHEVHILLRRTLRDFHSLSLTRTLLDCMVRIAPDGGIAELEAILSNPANSLGLRWAALDRMGQCPEAADVLLRRLQSHSDDSFISGKEAELLGELGAVEALPTLRSMAESDMTDPQLRGCAITALAGIGTSAALASLLRLSADSVTPLELRVAAVSALPATIDPDTCRGLRQLLRAERRAPELAAALTQALARAGDHEALPQFMRCAQSEHRGEAIAGIEAMASLGDPSMAPVLVRISQSSQASPAVRLSAVIALLRLQGAEHLTLLRDYLDSAPLPLRLQAHGALSRISPDDPRLVTPLTDLEAPLLLRLAALEHLVRHSRGFELMAQLLQNNAEPAQLRLAVAAALEQSGEPAAVDTLATLATPEAAASTAGNPALLRRRCILALGAIAAGADTTAEPARARLAAMAAGPDEAVEHRLWATQALLERQP